MTSNTQALLGLYAGPDGYQRLLAKLAQCNNKASRDYYLDLMIDHPSRPTTTEPSPEEDEG